MNSLVKRRLGQEVAVFVAGVGQRGSFKVRNCANRRGLTRSLRRGFGRDPWNAGRSCCFESIVCA